ncbi:MAG: ester cyclase [Microbacterium sp.]|uniref:ester cyclase n=1 Tax=Microbacterium sp. TaxID=51671 RepID=UPI0039E6CC62
MTEHDQATATANKRLVERYHRRLWEDGDLSAIDEVFADDAVVHFSGWDGSAVQTVRDDAARYRAAFDDISTTILALIAEDDRVVLHWTTRGTHIGGYGAVAATGKAIDMSGIDIFRLREGQIVECWSVWDGIDVYDQMGALPELW